MTRLYSDDPKRRVAEVGTISQETLSNLAKSRYKGVARHKKKQADYGFAPRPVRGKSVCDDLRDINLKEATRLFRSGIAAGMISRQARRGLPKYVWAVDDGGEVYEAKTSDGATYYGYRLPHNDKNFAYIMAEWRKRTA